MDKIKTTQEQAMDNYVAIGNLLEDMGLDSTIMHRAFNAERDDPTPPDRPYLCPCISCGRYFQKYGTRL